MKKSNFPDPGIEAASLACPALAGRFPTSSAPGNACCKPTFINTEAPVETSVFFLLSFPVFCSISTTQIYNDCEKYPPFTAEKQIELIEFMLKKYGEETIGFELWKDNSYHVMCHLGYDGFENYADANTLGGAIAGLITLYWKDFTEAEQNEIRRILE